jgi:hypothetical protein
MTGRSSPTGCSIPKFSPVRLPAPWPAARLSEARAVVADIARHSDHLIRLACNVLAVHGLTDAERKDAQALLFVIDARRPLRRAQREDADWRVTP